MQEDDQPRELPFLVFHLPEKAGLRDVAEKISRLGSDRFREVSGFAFVFANELSDDPSQCSGVLAYERDRPVYIVDRIESRLRLRVVEESGLIDAESQEVLHQIRRDDLIDLMSSDGASCSVEPNGNYHFVTPSLIHTNRFIRLGDLIRNKAVLDRLSFWLEDLIAEVDCLLVDTWSISSVAIRAMQKLGKDLPFDCLPIHPSQDRAASQKMVSTLIKRIPNGGKILVLISISGSGRLERQIEELLLDASGDQIEYEIVSLFGFVSTPPGSNCLARIDDKKGSFPEAECGFCDQGSVPIQIDGSTYHVRSWKEQLVMTGERHFTPSRSFVNAYKDVSGAWSVHRDDPADMRHHAFDVDVGVLLGTDTFRAALLEKLQSFAGKKDLVIVPEHSTALAMGKIAKDLLNCEMLVHDTLDRRRLDSASFELLKGKRDILIVDDSINSGSRVSRYLQSLREGGYEEFNSVDVLVGVARTESEKIFATVSRSVSDRHSWTGEIHFVEKFFLPNWSENRCPWCKEFDFISSLAEIYPKPPQWLIKRNRELSMRQSGISHAPLFAFPDIVVPVLGDESKVCNGGASANVVTLAVASGLQQHRHDPKPEKQLHPDFPLANVVDPEQFRDRYTEGLIRATLLRTSTREELGVRAAAETRDLLFDRMREENQKIVAGEMLMAIARSGFPTISASRFLNEFSPFLPASDLQKIATLLQLP